MSSLESSKGPLSADETQQANRRETVDVDVPDPHRSKVANFLLYCVVTMSLTDRVEHQWVRGCAAFSGDSGQAHGGGQGGKGKGASDSGQAHTGGQGGKGKGACRTSRGNAQNDS